MITRGDLMKGVKWGIMTIGVSNFKKMIDFYTKTLGFKLETYYKDDWAEIKANDLYIGFYPKEEEPEAAGNVGVSFGVASLDKEMADLKKKGVKFYKVEDDEDMRLVTFEDPEGNELTLVEKK
jgi:predicted enzyme related to lactoylglutathione lyase